MTELADNPSNVHRQLLELVVGDRATSEPSANGFTRCYRRVPEVRALLKTPLLKNIQALPNRQALDIWHHVYLNTPSYDLGSRALYFYQYKTLGKPEFNKLKTWLKRVDCWEHSDDLSKIFADTLEQQPDWVLPVLSKWNRARNPWQRRQSVVALLEYTQKRKQVQPYDTLISFVEPLLDDQEYYVQKGVGWTLREIYNAYPEEMTAFFSDRYPDIKPTAWSAATEKLDKKLKKELNSRRKTSRSSNL